MSKGFRRVPRRWKPSGATMGCADEKLDAFVEACPVLSFPGIHLTPYQGCVKIDGVTGSS
jgi:hypothetical protein